MKDRAFENPDINYLKSAARSAGAEVVIPSDIRQAQELKDRGLPIPGSLDPVEVYLLLEITKRIQAGAAVPKGFVVYLNDRAVTDIPEDVPTTMDRQERIAFSTLMAGLTKITSNRNTSS